MSRFEALLRRGAGIWFGILVAVGWEVASHIPRLRYAIPSPRLVVVEMLASAGHLWGHSLSTLATASVGLGMAATAALTLASLFCVSPLARRAGYHWVFAVQSVPVVAVAPIILNSLGFGLLAKSSISFLIAVFPLTIQTTRGMEAVPPEALDLFRSLGASRSSLWRKLLLPSSMPFFLNGMRTAAALAVVGAIVAEISVPERGLGYWIYRKSIESEFHRAYGGVVLGAGLSLLLVSAVSGFERLFKPRSWT